MTQALNIFSIVVLAFLLICIRTFENNLFYDPLLLFFKTDHTTQSLPQIHTIKLIVFTVFRFLMNTVISLAILWVVFKKVSVVKFSAMLYGVLLVILLIMFFLLLKFSAEAPHMLLFYTRRFLIQPIFLLILLPAFYFQKITTS
ncbi:exosortase F system-associated membrane protein [Patiriisocius marinistellae]|uniref:exosortase F system-associated membrane protein n=1 Tax=Patiriisocius marinistellae TaxID=2494560 RepID=UPI00125E2D91|nr:exosortase F system-associated protein [Patiriisocius marinistellae]